MQSRPYLEADCQTLSVLPGSAICGGSGGADILRLTVSAEQEPWHFNSLSISNEVINTATNISRVGNAWAAPLLSNQTYVLALTDQRMTALEFEIYPLTPLSSVTLQMTLSNSTDLLSVEFGNRSLQLGQQLPPNSTVSTASFDAGTRLLSLSFVGSANGLSQVSPLGRPAESPKTAVIMNQYYDLYSSLLILRSVGRTHLDGGNHL